MIHVLKSLALGLALALGYGAAMLLYVVCDFLSFVDDLRGKR